MGHGGARNGAGRKKATHTLEREEMKRQLVERVKKDFMPIMEGLIAAAKPHWVGVKDSEGNVVNVFLKEPEMAAIKELFNRVWGLPEQNLDHTSGGQPIFLPNELMQKHGIHSGTEADSN